MPCPVARTLDLVGEWWTLLIVRDALHGARRFEEFKATGIADNILATRLQKLTEAGILKRRRYQTRPERYEYLLTAKGRSLGPIVMALRQWGKRWTSGTDMSRIRHETCGHDLTLEAYCLACDERVEAHDVEVARVA